MNSPTGCSAKCTRLVLLHCWIGGRPAQPLRRDVAPEVPFTNVPPDDTYDTHEDTRRTFAAQEQLNTFLSTGTVVHYCDGVCDPE